MTTILEKIENSFIMFGVFLMRTFFFFLDDAQQSLLTSFFHYAIFIVGFYFFIYASPKSWYRIFFFVFIVFSASCYFAFDKCIITHVELSLSEEKNKIQETMETFFGSQVEGNLSSKVILTALAIISGMILWHDR
jgi:glucan phosphoethanolaminetransferase (alkaline phosphatase superfamily)